MLWFVAFVQERPLHALLEPASEHLPVAFSLLVLQALLPGAEHTTPVAAIVIAYLDMPLYLNSHNCIEPAANTSI